MISTCGIEALVVRETKEEAMVVEEENLLKPPTAAHVVSR